MNCYDYDVKLGVNLDRAKVLVDLVKALPPTDTYITEISTLCSDIRKLLDL